MFGVTCDRLLVSTHSGTQVFRCKSSLAEKHAVVEVVWLERSLVLIASGAQGFWSKGLSVQTVSCKDFWCKNRCTRCCETKQAYQLQYPQCELFLVLRFTCSTVQYLFHLYAP